MFNRLLQLARPSLTTNASSARGRHFATSPRSVVGLAWDLETTGFSRQSEIVQISVTVATGVETTGQSFSQYVMPTGQIDPRATQTHAITKQFLAEQGARPFELVISDLIEWIELSFAPDTALVWAAHNGTNFDRPILESAMGSTQFEAIRGEHVDTLHLARAVVKSSGKGSHTLGACFHEATGHEMQGAHDALADAKATAAVWEWLVEQGADTRVDALPKQDRFAAHLLTVATEGPVPRSSNNTRVSVKKPKAADLPEGSLLAISGLGPATETVLIDLEITNTSQLLEAIRAGGGDTTEQRRQWMRTLLPKLHPGSRAKIVSWLETHDDA